MKDAKPLPEQRARLPYARTFDAADHAQIIRGLEPREMEDKWLIVYDEPWLWFHRSWTGIAIYGVKLRREGEGSVVEEAVANRAPDQYRETDDAHDAAILSFLVERLLLGREVPFPVREGFPKEKISLLVHHVVGNASPAPAPPGEKRKDGDE